MDPPRPLERTRFKDSPLLRISSWIWNQRTSFASSCPLFPPCIFLEFESLNKPSSSITVLSVSKPSWQLPQDNVWRSRGASQDRRRRRGVSFSASFSDDGDAYLVRLPTGVPRRLVLVPNVKEHEDAVMQELLACADRDC